MTIKPDQAEALSDHIKAVAAYERNFGLKTEPRAWPWITPLGMDQFIGRDRQLMENSEGGQ